MKLSAIFILLFSFTPCFVFSQISLGGQPASYGHSGLSEIPVYSLPVPDLESIRTEDSEKEKEGLPRRVGMSVPAGIDVTRDGMKDILPDGTRVWRLSVACEGALAVGLYFDDFFLPDGYRMFVYDREQKHLIGAYTLYNNRQNRLFSTELIPGDGVVVEINTGQNATAFAECHISEISYVYRDYYESPADHGNADECEVNINCPEGDNWQYQKHGVARIYVKYNSGFYWCTGALLNNTLQNNEPYFLTANHCAPAATAEELAQWIFYFNFEAPGCENPSVTPASNSMTGAIYLASSSTTTSSDFLLLRLADTVPLSYEPFYNGWSIENIPSPDGVTIHHPAGDIKKISTYTVPLESSWKVYWSETVTNWGVTEGGSSGSPLYDHNGRVIGALTGGQAACEPGGSGSGIGPDQPDFYGKFWYSWDQNGSEPSQQLKYWLDPINSGVTTIPGKNASLTAAFQADETLLLKGNSVGFVNLSSGLPVSWEWSFEGGQPGSFSGSQPPEITYPEVGTFDVGLIVSNGLQEDTLVLKDYIHVVGKVYPNPTSGWVNIFLEQELPNSLKIEVFNLLGQKVHEEEVPEQVQRLLAVDLTFLGCGIYSIRIQIDQRYIFAKVLVNR
ncbi:MAG: T9SS type A sorting domain-containing protein [Bacteroidales bacterium]|nr:T9SS type A sorting domain-containing protein [Bacteroidales bacterium]